MYVYLQAGKQGFMKKKTENNSNPICVPRNTLNSALCKLTFLGAPSSFS